MNFPCRLDFSNQSATAVFPALMSPKLTVREGVTPCPLTSEPMIWKSINRPFSFSTILG